MQRSDKDLITQGYMRNSKCGFLNHYYYFNLLHLEIVCVQTVTTCSVVLWSTFLSAQFSLLYMLVSLQILGSNQKRLSHWMQECCYLGEQVSVLVV